MLNNIKSSYILKLIFQKVANKKKLKLVKYNKILLRKLEITIEDYKSYKNLREFNNFCHYYFGKFSEFKDNQRY